MPADGRVQELVGSGEGLENQSQARPPPNAQFNSEGIESEDTIPLRLGHQQTEPGRGAGAAPLANEAKLKFLRMETVKESVEDSRASILQREALATPKNRFSKITTTSRPFAEDYSQEADAVF
jgi:hypothetical protein